MGSFHVIHLLITIVKYQFTESYKISYGFNTTQKYVDMSLSFQQYIKMYKSNMNPSSRSFNPLAAVDHFEVIYIEIFLLVMVIGHN